MVLSYNIIKREFYDLWSILKNYGSTVDHARLLKTLDQKCIHRNVSYKSTDDFFTLELLVFSGKL